MTHEEGTPLQEWFNANRADRKYNFATAADEQVLFVRDQLHRLFVPDYDHRREHPVRVVSGHTSKSTRLPVFSIKVPGVVEVRMRGNYFNWVVSVKVEPTAPRVGAFYPGHLVNEEDWVAQVKQVWAEGFDPEWIFPPMGDLGREFSVTLPYNMYVLFTFMWLLTENWLNLHKDL